MEPFKRVLLFLIILQINYVLCNEVDSASRKIRSVDFINSIKSPVWRLFHKGGSDNSTEITPVGEVPAHPIWKVHKYNGVHLKPINLGSVPYLEVPTNTFKKPQRPFSLPSLEDLQTLLGTNTKYETFVALKEMASTRSGLKLIIDYIKANGGGSNIEEPKKEEVDAVISHYQSEVPPEEIPSTTTPPAVVSEDPSFLSSIKSHFSKFYVNPVSDIKANIDNKIKTPLLNKVFIKKPINLIHHGYIKPIPVYIIPQIVHKPTQKPIKKPTPAPVYGPPPQHQEVYGPPQEPVEIYGPPPEPVEAYGPPPEPVEVYGPPTLVKEPFEPFQPPPPPVKPTVIYGIPTKNEHVDSGFASPVKIYGPPSPPENQYGSPNFHNKEITGSDSASTFSNNDNHRFIGQSASIQVAPVERGGSDTIIPFPVLPELPELPSPEKMAYFRAPESAGSGSFRYVPISNFDQVPSYEPGLFTPNVPEPSAFSFSGSNQAAADSNAFSQIGDIPLDNGAQFSQAPGQVTSFGDRIPSYIFDDSQGSASEPKAVIIKSDNRSTTTTTTTVSSITKLKQRPRWTPKSRRKPDKPTKVTTTTTEAQPETEE